jgi:hypothetical protein
MNIFLPTKAKDIKGAVAIAELKRAHLIIAMLAIAFAVIIGLVSTNEIQLDAALGAIATLLLVLVALVSLGTVYALRNRK